MKYNAWTLALVGAGLVSLPAVSQAEEKANAVQTALSSTTISGYVDTSAIWKPGTGNYYIPGRAFDGGPGNLGGDKLDGFNLNVVKLSIGKPLDESEWAAGYQVDLLFGPDAYLYNTSANALDTPGDFSIQQAYVSLRAPVGNGIDLKLGTFSTFLGYEVFDAGSNPNFSRSYGWQLEPTQHTGLIASYVVNENISLSGGVANTHLAFINLRDPGAESSKAYMGAVTFTAPKEGMGFLGGSSLTFGVMDGFAGNNNDTTSLYAGTTLATPVTGLTVGAAWDYRVDGYNSVTANNNWATAIGLYASYQATEKLKLSVRGDYTVGSDGTFVDAGLVGVSDNQNKLGALTATVDYSLWANVISRVECRWDHSLSGENVYDDASLNNVVTIAANIIYKF
jgi:hypothetical protein